MPSKGKPKPTVAQLQRELRSLRGKLTAATVAERRARQAWRAVKEQHEVDRVELLRLRGVVLSVAAYLTGDRVSATIVAAGLEALARPGGEVGQVTTRPDGTLEANPRHVVDFDDAFDVSACG